MIDRSDWRALLVLVIVLHPFPLVVERLVDSFGAQVWTIIQNLLNFLREDLDASNLVDSIVERQRSHIVS